MTNVLSIKSDLFNYLKDHNQIILPDDFSQIIKISEYPEFDLAIMTDSLKSFEAADILKRVEFVESKKNKVGYLLTKPLTEFSQSLEISGEIAFYLASILNEIKDDDDNNTINPLNITQKNIEDLIILVSNLLKQHKDNQENIAKESENGDISGNN